MDSKEEKPLAIGQRLSRKTLDTNLIIEDIFCGYAFLVNQIVSRTVEKGNINISDITLINEILDRLVRISNLKEKEQTVSSDQ